MGIHFTCKTKEQPIFRNDLVPGRAASGINGERGESGLNGQSIHFSDYSPNNDYIKGMMREKIRKNLVLSSGNTINLQGIKYTSGDIILSKDLLVYRLEMNNENIDFTYLGKLTDKQREADLSVEENLINNIGEIELKNFTENVFDIAIPSNRCIDSSASMLMFGHDYNNKIIGEAKDSSYPDSSIITEYNKTFKKTFGFSFKPIIHISDESIWRDWNFYLRIYTKIKKSPQHNSYILDDSEYETLMDPTHKSMQGAFEFYKYAEMKLNAKLDGSTAATSYQTDIDSSAAVYNITDMSCDKLHPAGNNVNSNFIHSHNYITRTVPFALQSRRIRLGGIDNLRLQYFLLSSPGSIRTGETPSLNSSVLETIFSYFSLQVFRTSSYNDQRGYLQYSMYNPMNPNFRSGDSAYFSGMYMDQYPQLSFNQNRAFKVEETTTNKLYPYDNFIKHERVLNSNTPLLHDQDNPSFALDRLWNEKSYVCLQLNNFIFNPENTYELACVSKKTGEVKILNTRIKKS